MAKMYVSEYATPGNLTQVGAEPSTDSVVTFTTTTQSSTFQFNTNLVRIHVDGIASIAFGLNPTATTSNKRLVAGQTEYFAIPAGQSWKVAAVTNT